MNVSISYDGVDALRPCHLRTVLNAMRESYRLAPAWRSFITLASICRRVQNGHCRETAAVDF